MMQNFLQPPILQGSTTDQLRQLRQWLYRLSTDLNVALTSLSAENFSGGTLPAGQSNGAQKGGTTVETQGVSELKSLIIKTANTVRREVDVLETELRSSLVAQSDFGTFAENINTTVRDSAESIERLTQYQAALTDSLNGLGDDFEQYVIESSGYIKQGIIGYDDAVPIIGIAIGQDIRVSGTETVDGREYEVIDTSSNVSTWTPRKLTFYVNGLEAAYVSNGAFYAPTLHVLGRQYHGSGWEISHDNGFTIKWIGG